jgi:hypothetical protein
MSARYVYILGRDDRRYCWAVHPTFRCANGEPPADTLPADLLEAASKLRCAPQLLAGMSAARTARSPPGAAATSRAA